MLRDFARRCEQWASVIEDKDETRLKDVVHVLTTELGLTMKAEKENMERLSPIIEREPDDRAFVRASDLPPSSAPSPPTPSIHPWRRGDYFFCEGCGQRKQW